MRQLSHELLPGTNRRENQEFETNVPAAHGSTAALYTNRLQVNFMFTKSKEISNSQILLKIEPMPKKENVNYLLIFASVVFVILSVLLSRLVSVARQPKDIVFVILIIVLLFIAGIVLLRFKPTPLLFTEKGITDGLFISIFWRELGFYYFVTFPDIGPKKGRRTLRLISDKPPLYDLKFLGLPRELYDRGLFFSESEITKAEEIFKAKGISKKAL